MASTWKRAAVLPAFAALLSCKSEPTKPVPLPSKPVAPRADAGPPPPTTPPTILVDARGCVVDDKAFAGLPATWKDKLALALEHRPFVAGETVRVEATTDTRTSKVAAVAAALEAARAKGAKVHTRTHAGQDVEIALAFDGGMPPDPCVAKVAIQHDLTVRLQGGKPPRETVRRSAMGFDAEGTARAIARRLAGCATEGWQVSAADSVPWTVPTLIVAAFNETDAGPRTAVSVRLVPFEEGDGGR
jgi:hypothetical protein